MSVRCHQKDLPGMGPFLGLPHLFPLLEAGIEPGCPNRLPIHTDLIVASRLWLGASPAESCLLPGAELRPVLRAGQCDVKARPGRIRGLGYGSRHGS